MKCVSHNAPCQGICLSPNCQQLSRLTCFECLLSQVHQGHNQAILDFHTLDKLDGNFTFLQEISNNQDYGEVISENLIDRLFEQLRSELLDQLEVTKMQLKSKLHVLQQQQKSSVKINQSVSQALFIIKKLINKYKNGSISTNLFNEETNQLINSLTNKEKKLSNVPYFDQTLFQQLSKNIIDEVKNFNKLLSTSYQHVLKMSEIENALVKTDNMLQIQQIKFIGSKQGIVTSTEVLSYGIYEIRLRIDKEMQGAVCVGLIGEDQKWQLNNCYPCVNLNGFIKDDVKYAKRSRGYWKSEGLKQGDLINIEIDLDHGIFRIKDNQDFSELEIVQTQHKKFKFFIVDYDGRNNELSLLRSGRYG